MNEMFAQGGKGSTGILTNKQAIARKYGVKQSEIVYFGVGVDLGGYTTIYDKTTQRSYVISPVLPTGSIAINLNPQAVLTYSGGSIDLGAVAVTRDEFVKLTKTFTTGVSVNTKNELVEHDGIFYRWAGNLPKDVPSGSTPDSTGGISDSAWKVYTDSLKTELAEDTGYTLIGGLDNVVNPNHISIPNITDTSLQSSYALGVKSGNIVRFANTNLWTAWSTANYFGGDYTSPEKAKQLKKLWLMVGADVWGWQEVFVSPKKTIDMFKIAPYTSAYFMAAKEARENGGYAYGTACMTRLPVTSHEGIKFNSAPSVLDQEWRVYNKLKLANGVNFYNVHLSIDPVRAELMMDMLLADIAAEGNSKVVILGDFNLQDITKYTRFENAGFTIVNKGTWNSIDKIMVRGVTIANTGMVKILGGSPWQYLSDHDLYYVDVEI